MYKLHPNSMAGNDEIRELTVRYKTKQMCSYRVHAFFNALFTISRIIFHCCYFIADTDLLFPD